MRRPSPGGRGELQLRLSSAALIAAAFFLACAASAEDNRPRMFRDRVDPHWFANNHRFWYANNLPGGAKEFILVDVEKGTRALAFDPERAAAALNKAAGTNLTVDRLNVEIASIEDDACAVTLQLRGKAWHLDLKTYVATSAKPTEIVFGNLTPRENPFSTPHTGAETTVKFVNKLAVPATVFWIDESGARHQYAEIQPNDFWESNTYEGHVWLVKDKSNQLQRVFQATNQPSTAVIENTTQAPPQPERPRRSRGNGDSPDGKWSAVVRANKLFVRNIDTGTEILLGDDGKPSDTYAPDRVWWSPDSKKLVALRTEPTQEHKIYEIESSPKDQLQPKLKTIDYLKPGDRIAHPRPQLFDIATKQHIAIKEDLFPNPWSLDSIRWSSDSSRFTFLYNERGHQALKIIAIDAATGAVKSIIDERSDTFICYSSKFHCQWIGENEILWMSERDGWNHLWLIDAQTGAVKNQITRGEWVVQSVARVDEAKRVIWFNAGGIRPGQDPYYTHYCRVNFDGTGLVMLTEGDGNHTIKLSPDQSAFIDTYSRVDAPPVTELRNAETGKLICPLEAADAHEVLAARGGRWPERFAAKGRDGTTDIYGIVIFPRDFDPNKKYPVVENIYAGPHGFFTPKSFRERYGHQQQIADLGMIVVQCDGMGTSGRSKKFHDVCWKNLRDAGFPDRIAWIKSAAQKFPQMDLARVGIYGGSAGGQSAMAALLWHNDFYKVAVADCGCHDNRMDKIWWNEQWMGWPIGKEYAENSNAVNANLLQGKLMLIVGELDTNVDPASTMQVVGALQKANKDFDYIVIAGSNHGAAETPYGSHRRSQFLAQNLLGH